MGSLRINQVVYEGDSYFFHSPIFDNNLILIEGDNGTGKTTFCNLIYFGLGGSVSEFRDDGEKKHKEITRDSNNWVDLYVTISGKNYQLKRYIKDNDISITEYVAQVDDKGDFVFDVSAGITTLILPINRSKAEVATFSDWMLGQLGISVVELYQGYDTFKINFVDLMRLIYHDQKTEPEYVYKKIDVKQTYFSDSELRRKATFELLIGKAFSDYYDAIVEAKRAEKSHSGAKEMLDEYKIIANGMRGRGEIKNKTFLESELREKDAIIEKLQYARESFKRNRSVEANVEPAIENLKSRMLEAEVLTSELNAQLLDIYDERSKLLFIKENTAKEITQVTKVIHTHDQLNLFSADTCPYCLTKIERTSGHCVCGSEIDEAKYQRFFYTSQEYKEIYKAKTKTLSTIQLAIDDCNDEVESIKAQIKFAANNVVDAKEKLHALVNRMDQRIDINSLNDIDDKLLDTREEMALLRQRIDIETKLEKLQLDVDQKRDVANIANTARQLLEIKTKDEIRSKVNTFSEHYNVLMTRALSACRTARISNDDYMPIINDGEYKERSSAVSIRLMYFLTMMEMSLVNSDVPYPHFMLVDTPETAGIEPKELLNCLKQISGLERFNLPYQIILTTGLGKYPPEFLSKRVMFMPDEEHALLQKRN